MLERPFGVQVPSGWSSSSVKHGSDPRRDTDHVLRITEFCLLLCDGQSAVAAGGDPGQA